MIPYSEREQRTLVERLCNDIFSTAGKSRDRDQRQSTQSVSADTVQVQPPLQLLFDLEFEQKFMVLMKSIYRRLPAL